MDVVTHCNACHAHIHLLIFWGSDSVNRHILGCDPQIRTQARFVYNAPNRQVS